MSFFGTDFGLKGTVPAVTGSSHMATSVTKLKWRTDGSWKSVGMDCLDCPAFTAVVIGERTPKTTASALLGMGLLWRLIICQRH